MATSPTLLSIEEYLHTSYKPDVHFVDGEIEERNLGEHTHNFIQGFIYHLFTLNVDIWASEAIVEQHIRINSSRVRVCDVVVIGADDPFEEVMTRTPLICVEILSPEDRIARVEVVLADYFAMGVPNIWLIDPIRRIAYNYDATGLHTASLTNLSVAGTPIVVDLTPAFAQLDKKAARNPS